MIGPTDLLHPSPAPHFKTFQVFMKEKARNALCPVTADDEKLRM
jgi:hypothetical protein